MSGRAAVPVARGAVFSLLALALALYYAFHASLPKASNWTDVALISLLLMPLVFGLVYLVLPFARARELQLALVGLAFVALAAILRQAGLDAPSDFAKLAAMTALSFWFLRYFESISWVVLVACIVPFVDAYSVWRGPTNRIVHNHAHLFTVLSFAFPLPGEQSGANLGLPDLLFFGIFLGASVRFGLRPFATWVGLVASFGATIAIAVAWGKAGLPALPLLSVAFLAVNSDLLLSRLRAWRAEKAAASGSSPR